MIKSIDQQMVQRFLSAKSKKTAQVSLILNTPLLFLIISLCCFIGLILYANFFKCDPLTDNSITNPNQLVTFYVIKNLKDIPGFSGLFLGSLFCGNSNQIFCIRRYRPAH
jgi:Na+/proline symporter